MSRALRKSCRACTRAKRRCIVQLPQCQRCVSKQIECVYDLEPLLKSSVTQLQKSRYLVAAEKDAPHVECPSERFLDYITSLHLDPNMVATTLIGALRGYETTVFSVPVSSDPVTTQYLVAELRQIPNMVLDGLPSTFIHMGQQPDVRRRFETLRDSFPSFDHLQHLFGPTDDFGGHHILQMLSRCNVRDGTLQEGLINFQALVLFALGLLFGSDQTERHSAHLLIRSMKKVANDFVSYAPSLMPANLPPWENWILAESVRRTILMVYLVRGAYSSWVRGYCKHELFTEALPLDARGGLWTAESRLDWEARSGSTRISPRAHGVTSQLLSFHDFNSTFARVPYDPGPDSYLKLLLIAHHGKAAMDRLITPGQQHRPGRRLLAG